MTYENFLQYIQQSTKEIAGEGGTVTINHVIKNNGCELDGLVIMEKNRHISPTIYLNSFYYEFQKGRDLEDILLEITQLYLDNKDKIQLNAEYFKDFKTVKHTIAYKIINYEKNRRLLEVVPHKKILDLAVVFYCLLDQQAQGSASALIYHTHLKNWDVTEDDVYQVAINNTPLLLHSSIRSMSAIIREMLSMENMLEQSNEPMPEASNDMYVLTNQSQLNGAACMLYDDVLKDFADQIEHDLFILPSSIHEVILLPKLTEFKAHDLAHMVREVNSEGVSDDEILSDNVYLYTRRTGMVTFACQERKQMQMRM